MLNEELKKGSDEIENLSEEHQKLCRMCGDLKRVNAPKNFDLHLKARIANCDKSDYQPNPFLPFLRYAVPLCVVLLLAGFVVFSGILTGNQNANPTLAQNVQPLQSNNDEAIIAEKAETKASENTQISANSNTTLAAANTEPPKSASNVQTTPSSNKAELAPSANKNLLLGDDFGGSRTSASRESKVINPPGIEPKQNSAEITSANVSVNNSSSVKELLSLNGIEASFVNSGWKVKSVAPNTLASRIGIKVVDVIEATDTLRLNNDIFFRNRFSI